MKFRMKFSVNQMVKIGVLSALSLVLMFLIRFPLIPAAPFLEYEPADVPILIGTFLYGPVTGLIMTAIVSLIQAMTVSAGSGWIGAVMHMAATGALVLIAGLVYKKLHTFRGAIIGLSSGIVAMTVVMTGLNLVFTPMFMGVPVEAVKAMLIPVIIPFNLLKGLMNSVLVCMVYKHVSRLFKAEQSIVIKADRTQKTT